MPPSLEAIAAGSVAAPGDASLGGTAHVLSGYGVTESTSVWHIHPHGPSAAMSHRVVGKRRIIDPLYGSSQPPSSDCPEPIHGLGYIQGWGSHSSGQQCQGLTFAWMLNPRWLFETPLEGRGRWKHTAATENNPSLCAQPCSTMSREQPEVVLGRLNAHHGALEPCVCPPSCPGASWVPTIQVWICLHSYHSLQIGCPPWCSCTGWVLTTQLWSRLHAHCGSVEQVGCPPLSSGAGCMPILVLSDRLHGCDALEQNACLLLSFGAGWVPNLIIWRRLVAHHSALEQS